MSASRYPPLRHLSLSRTIFSIAPRMTIDNQQIPYIIQMDRPVLPLPLYILTLRMIHSIEKAKVSQSALRQISEFIRAGMYAPGDQLPSERQLAQQLGVSRTSVREALRKLEMIGLVEIRQGLGTFVKDPSSEKIQAALVPYLLTNPETLLKVFELREIIEVEAAGRAAERADAGQIAVMQHWAEAVESYIARGNLDSMVIADVEFHRQIIIATDNEVLVDLMDSIVDLLREMRRASPTIPELRPEIITGHRAILAAIQAADSQAARQAMQAHLNGVRSRLKDFWAQKSIQEQPINDPEPG